MVEKLIVLDSIPNDILTTFIDCQFNKIEKAVFKGGYRTFELDSEPTWSCVHCLFTNEVEKEICDACLYPRQSQNPTAPTASEAEASAQSTKVKQSADENKTSMPDQNERVIPR